VSYPEHEKLHEELELQEFSNRLGAYFDDESSRLKLAEWGPAPCNNCDGTGQVYDFRTDQTDDCTICDGTGNDPELRDLHFARGGLNKLLAEMLGVDYDKLMDEKDQMLADLRAAQIV